MKAVLLAAAVTWLAIYSIAGASTVSAANRVVAMRNLPPSGKRQAHAFCNVKGKLAVIGGRGRKSSYFYNGQTNTWENFGFLPRNYSTIHHVQCVQYKNGLILAGGFMGGAFPKELPAGDVVYWNLKNSKFLNLGKMPESRARGSSAITLWQNKLYFFGGSTLGHGQGPSKTKRWADVFDPATMTWKQLRDAGLPRDHHGVARIGEKVYVAGGRLGGAENYTDKQFAYKLVEIYNLRTGRWGQVREKSLAFHPGSTPAACGPLLVLAGGEIERATNDVRVKQTEVYSTSQKKWKRRFGSTSQIAQFKDRHAAPLATCNKVVYRAAGAQRFPNKPGSLQNQERMQLEALLLDGKVRSCIPSSFWRGVRRAAPQLATARFFRQSNATPPPLATPPPVEGTMVPEIQGMGDGSGIAAEEIPSQTPSESV